MVGAQQMRNIISAVKKMLPKGFGVTILVYPFGESVLPANYISDSEREDMIKMMRETADRLEQNQDGPTIEEN